MKEDVACLPSQKHFDNPALKKDIIVFPTTVQFEFSPSHCHLVVPFLCVLLKKEVRDSYIKTDHLTLEA